MLYRTRFSCWRFAPTESINQSILCYFGLLSPPFVRSFFRLGIFENIELNRKRNEAKPYTQNIRNPLFGQDTLSEVNSTAVSSSVWNRACCRAVFPFWRSISGATFSPAASPCWGTNPIHRSRRRGSGRAALRCGLFTAPVAAEVNALDRAPIDGTLGRVRSPGPACGLGVEGEGVEPGWYSVNRTVCLVFPSRHLFLGYTFCFFSISFFYFSRRANSERMNERFQFGASKRPATRISLASAWLRTGKWRKKNDTAASSKKIESLPCRNFLISYNFVPWSKMRFSAPF